MNNLVRKITTPVGVFVIATLFFVSAMVIISSNITHAGNGKQSQNGRLITIHDRDIEKVILSESDTIGDALKEAGVSIDSKDVVEPALDEKLVASDYQVNIYRARPVVIVDGKTRTKIITPYQTAEQIAQSADIQLYPEDKTTLKQTDNIIADGAGLQLVVDRAMPFSFTLFGKTTTVRTQAKTVGEMLKEKNITLGKDGRSSLSNETPITDNLAVRVWREGKQTTTIQEEIPFETETIKDADREVGYKEVRAAGEKGSKDVTYEITIQDGNEVSRAVIASLTTKVPKKQVEVIGAKPTFSGDFAAALAKLRSCEGGYNSWNASGPYYGAYQFDRQTWGTVADPSKFGSATPAEQDDAAYKLYLRRGWQPWPVCGARVLPDIYR